MVDHWFNLSDSDGEKIGKRKRRRRKMSISIWLYQRGDFDDPLLDDKTRKFPKKIVEYL